MTDEPPVEPPDPLAISVRFESVDKERIYGLLGHDLRRGRQPAYVDSTRTHLNRLLIPYPEPSSLQQRTEQLHALTDSRRVLYKHSALAVSGIVTFGREAQLVFSALTPQQQNEAIRAVGTAIQNKTNCKLVGAVLHFDEMSPHAHLLFESRCGQSGLPFSRVKNLRQLQTAASEAISKPPR